LGIGGAFARVPDSPLAVTQTPFQRTLWGIARDAHAAGDRADARIMMKMIEAIDEGDYGQLAQLSLALRSHYRDRSGRVPKQRTQDVEGNCAS
jgi:hypothetical protein